MQMWKEFMKEFWKAAAFSPRLYFAPLVGAYRHTGREWGRAYRELSEDSITGSGTSQK